MQKKTWMIGLVALATMGSTYLPLPASADDAGVQDNTQTTVITGKGNSARQRNSQLRVNNANRVGVDSGTVQRSDQAADIDGVYNDSLQENQQISVDGGNSRAPRTNRIRPSSDNDYHPSYK